MLRQELEHYATKKAVLMVELKKKQGRVKCTPVSLNWLFVLLLLFLFIF